MREGGEEVITLLFVILLAAYVLFLPGYYEINQMAPIMNAPREQIWKTLIDPRTITLLCTPDMMPITVALESEEAVLGNCSHIGRVHFSVPSSFIVSIPWHGELIETHNCSVGAKPSWVEYRTSIFPFTTYRTTYFLEELVAVDGAVQTEVHERTSVRTLWLWQLLSEGSDRFLHARLLSNLRDVVECKP